MRAPRWALATALVIAACTCAIAGSDEPLRPLNAPEERIEAERQIVILRLDPRGGAKLGECDSLEAADLSIAIGAARVPAKVVAVERVPRPEKHWLLVDSSESAEDRRQAAMNSALQYVQSVMIPGEDTAALVTVDEDPILIDGPTTDTKELVSKLHDVASGSWSALRDGLDAVLRQIQGDRHEHVVLFWTDGEDQTSSTREADLLATLARTPNATVFPICLLPKGSKYPPPPMAGAIFTGVARRSGGEVFSASDPRWLDRVRGWLGRRFTVTYMPPPGNTGQEAVITVPWKRCDVTQLADPFATPDPIAGEAAPPPETWMKLHSQMRNGDDRSCATPKGTLAWAWPLSADAAFLSGCILDVVRATGPVVRDHDGVPDYRFQSPRFAARTIRIELPAFDELPADLVSAILPLLQDADAGGETSASFIDGSAFLAQRAQIAAALFAGRADFHKFAQARLAQIADAELQAIGHNFARDFPKLSAEEIALVARSSRAGSRSLASATHPTDADLARVLSAWIDDVSAVELFRAIERHFIDASIVRGPDDDLDALWNAALARFAMPSRVRIETPLALIHDPVQDVVGFVRIVLPRPEGFRSHDRRLPKAGDPLSARLMRRPLAVGLFENVADDAAVRSALRSGGYRATSIDYKALAVPFHHDPGKPYEEARVTVTLEGHDGARAVLEANVRGQNDGVFIVDRLVKQVTGDPSLDAILNGVRATLRRRSRPSRGPCCGRRRGSSRARGV
ncbi:MAG TPA: vWA domain-containing protein [Candidatus Polarisedimenticolaceae bacterium]|nr:vWA domain-containing protein [Candidatus Polarisedimenticolaceae bacterium]